MPEDKRQPEKDHTGKFVWQPSDVVVIRHVDLTRPEPVTEDEDATEE